MQRRILASLLVLVLAAFALPTFANETLDNQAVVEMVKLGLDQQVINAKIDASPNSFDTSAQALSSLKKHGVPSGVISKMISASNPAHNAGARQGNGDIKFINADGSAVAISPVRVTAELSYRKAWIPFHASGPETFMFLQGRRAPLRTAATPEFQTNMDPLMVRLIHLGQKNDRESRYVVFSGSTTDREVEVSTKDLGNGYFSITPTQPLSAGEEYAFLVVADMPAGYGFWTYFAQNAASSKAYDFGID